MAFMGLFFVGMILFLFFILFVLSILFLILGIVKHKKGKKIHVLFYVLSGSFFLPIAAMLLFIYMPKKESFETPTGTVSVWESTANEYIAALSAQDLSVVSNILQDNPQLVYYTDVNSRGILEYGMAACNIELMQLGLDYGAVFDSPLVYERLIYEHSLSLFFHNLGYHDVSEIALGDTTDEIIATINFILNNGATMEFPTDSTSPTFLFYVVYWVGDDLVITKKDMELIMYVLEQGCPFETTNSAGKTALEIFLEDGLLYNIKADALDMYCDFMFMLPE